MFTANVVIKMTNFSGDNIGNLHGNYGVYATADLAANGNPFSNINVTAKQVPGEDPLVTLETALKDRSDLPTMTYTADVQRATTQPPSPII